MQSVGERYPRGTDNKPPREAQGPALDSDGCGGEKPGGRGLRRWGRRGFAIITCSRLCGEALTEEVTFEQRPEISEG